MRLLHTMVRVSDLDRSINFYTEVLGMQLLRRKEMPAGKFTLVFLGYGPEETTAVLELTYNWGRDEPYDLGNGYGHIAIEVDDIYEACEQIRNMGGEITREPGPMKGSSTHLAFCRDPDGYMIELLEKKQD